MRYTVFVSGPGGSDSVTVTADDEEGARLEARRVFRATGRVFAWDSAVSVWAELVRGEG